LKNLCIHVIKKQGLCALKNKIKNSLMINKNRKKIYIYMFDLITWAFDMVMLNNLFIKIKFLSNQTIIKIDIFEID
jgi:hypothetical protein